MALKKQQIKANLIKYREAQMKDPIWFWTDTRSGAIMSPKFGSQDEAEKWFDTVVNVHNAASEILDRVKNGKFYNLKGRIDVGDLISSKKANECDFDLHLEDDILQVRVLAVSIADARKRIQEYFEILEWIE